MNQGHENSAIRSRIARVRRASVRRRLLWGLALLVAAGGGGVLIGFQLAREAPPEPRVADARAPEPERTNGEPSEPAHSAGRTSERLPEAPAPRTRQVELPSAEPALEPAPSTERGPERKPEAPAPRAGRAEPPPAEAAPRSGRAVEPPPEPASQTASPVDSAGNATSQQAQVEEALRRLEETLKSVSTAGSPLPGHVAALERIALGKEKALEAHRDGDADSALRLLAAAQREAEEVVREAEARYRIGLRAAKDAYAAGNPEAARMHVAQALERRPDSAEAQAWEARIARLPELLAQRRKAEDARGAGKLREERTALRRIVALDPGDAGAKARVQAVERQLRERAFDRTIAQGRRAVEEKKPEEAKRAVAEAQRRRPGHEDTRELQAQVAALERTLERDRRLADAEQAAARDDWEAALRAFEEARAIEPTHDGAVGGSGLAARIVAAQRAADDFLARPERLGSPAVAGAARETLRGAKALASLSARLETSAGALERAIEAGQTPVPVRILSDGRTEIGIRGVGRVGRTEERVIELRPGDYVFEGKRPGYRSRLVEVTVQAGGGAPVEVRIVCDERS